MADSSPKNSGSILEGQNSSSLLEGIKAAPIPSDPEHAASTMEKFRADLTATGENTDLLPLIDNNPALNELLLGIFGNSPFLTSLISRSPDFLLNALQQNPEQFMVNLGQELAAAIKADKTIDQAMKSLRLYKKQAALFIALTDLSDFWSLERILFAITTTADTALAATVSFLFKQAAKNGQITPLDPNHPENDSGYIVLAMGKQGAYELNYSSDVDLIVFFDRARMNLRVDIEAGQFFVKLTRNLVKMMQEFTADGYVFRTDLRLRPDPGATQIALSTEAAYSYYESFGQNWERAALIKARPVAGDMKAGKTLLEGLAPFIWRKYLDFAAIDDIHAMKRQIHSFKGHAQIAIEGHNIKLGRGGIREIEFFAQTQQLIAGGRQPELRTTKTLETLKALCENNWIKQSARDDLTEAYSFLRRIEHRIQMLNDEQTHTLPEGDVAMNRIAKFSGFKSIDDFASALRHQLETVQLHYAELFEDDTSLSSTCGNLVFVGDDPDPGTVETLESLGFSDPKRVIETVHGWHFGRYTSTRSKRARERLTEFQPLLIEAIAKTSQPDLALATFDRFLKNLPAGVQLFSLLSSNPNLLRLIADIMGTAPSLARVLGRRARVLDAVLDPGFFGTLPTEDDLRQIIETQFATCRDYQDTLDSARVLGQEQSFLIGVRLLSGVIDANKASRAYTRLAETIISELQNKVEAEMKEQHGSFSGAGASILAMGKLGGKEMTTTSDIDLILIYDFDKGQSPSSAIMSDGKKPLSPTQYYSRVTQRLISALSAPTAEGELYEVDMRLRPSGRAGPVATQLVSFISYQNTQAWVWEHLALTRARPITGPLSLQEKLNETISAVLSKPRDQQALLENVRDMRAKIEAEKGSKNIWNLKQVRGGQVDLEFICQTLQLQFASSHPEILDTNTIKSLLKIRDQKIQPEDRMASLITAATLYNNLLQMIRLCSEKGLVPEKTGEDLKQRLAQSADLPSFEALTGVLKQTQQEIKVIFDQIFSEK